MALAHEKFLQSFSLGDSAQPAANPEKKNG